MSSIKCSYCEKEISSKSNLSKHLKICKIKEKLDLDSRQQTQREQYENQLQTQREQYEQQIQNLTTENQTRQQQYEQQIQNLTTQYEQQLQNLKEQLDEFKTQIFEIAKQPKQINNNTQTTTNNNQRIMNITNPKTSCH
jgi:chromosome segregation ATPase